METQTQQVRTVQPFTFLGGAPDHSEVPSFKEWNESKSTKTDEADIDKEIVTGHPSAFVGDVPNELE